eukprot:749568-Hanusia_phi.AAC.2
MFALGFGGRNTACIFRLAAGATLAHQSCSCSSLGAAAMVSGRRRCSNRERFTRLACDATASSPALAAGTNINRPPLDASLAHPILVCHPEHHPPAGISRAHLPLPTCPKLPSTAQNSSRSANCPAEGSNGMATSRSPARKKALPGSTPAACAPSLGSLRIDISGLSARNARREAHGPASQGEGGRSGGKGHGGRNAR